MQLWHAIPDLREMADFRLKPALVSIAWQLNAPAASTNYIAVPNQAAVIIGKRGW